KDLGPTCGINCPLGTCWDGLCFTCFLVKRYCLWLSLVLGVIVLAVFSPVIHHEFIKFDDGEYITENPHVLTGLTWQNVSWAFSTTHASNWHPLTWLSHMLDAQLFGLEPGWHHLVSLLLHT